MANRDEVKGFRPWGRCTRATPYTAGGTIYDGDMVKLKSDGTIEQSAAGAAGSVGVALSYGVSGDTILVADDPAQKFVGQSDNSDIDAATDLNMNYNIIVASANTTYRRSGMEIDADTAVTNSNYPVKVLRVLPAIDNALGAQVRVIFQINNHQLAAGTGTLGV